MIETNDIFVEKLKDSEFVHDDLVRFLRYRFRDTVFKKLVITCTNYRQHKNKLLSKERENECCKPTFFFFLTALL